MNSPAENTKLNITESEQLDTAPDNEQINKKLTDESVVNEQLKVDNISAMETSANNCLISENYNNADSDNESLNNRTIKNKKKHNLIDSDSEDEPTTRPDPDSGSEKENLTPEQFQTPEKKKKSRLRKISNDSDSENEVDKSDENNVAPKEVLKVIESEINTPEKQKSRLNQLIDSDSDDESKLEEQLTKDNIDEDALQKEQAIRLKNLCDSESSADEEQTQKSPEMKTKKTQKSRKKSEPLAEKKMTGRDAMEQMRQIKSESQKMVRESRVSLPYHLPKQHTLQEFLKRRSMVPDVIDVSGNISTTFAIKMSSQELVKAAERLKEREKEIEEFYKVESEDSETEATEEINKENEVVDEKTEETKDKVEENNCKDVAQETQDKVEENNCKDVAEEIIPESEKQTIEEVTATGEPEVQASEETAPPPEKPNEEASKIEELRNVLIQYSCGNDSNMEQLVEQPEKIDEVPENSKRSKTPEEVVDLVEEAPEKLSEDFIENHFTANFRAVEETEAPQETLNKESELEKKLKNLNPIISLKKDFKPRLTGDGGDFVVLDDGLERSKGVSNLMKRFLLHTSNKSTPKKDALEVEATVHKEIEMEHEPDEAAKNNLTPGLKFKKLKANLEEQIVFKRLEEWKKKQEEFKMEVEDGGEKTECGLDEKILDEEDEEDMSDEESSEDSEEEEEEDVILEDKPKAKSAFVDDEAEESDEEDDVVHNNDDDESEAESESIEETSEKKPLKRIIQVFDEDSDDDDADEGNQENDEEITAYQPQTNGLEKTPCKPISENKNDLSTFLTPTFHLTALQGMNSTTKSINDSPGIALSPDPSPLRMHPLLKTKLFTEPEDASLEELENLCSGKFTGPTQQHPKQRFSGNKDLTTQENNLLNLCSGKFTGLTANPGPETAETPEEDNQFQITFDNDSLDEKLSEATSEIRNSQNSENTQHALNPEPETTQTEAPSQFPKLNATKFVIASSDEEEEDTEVKRKKKTKKKYIIDDISISEDEDTANQDDFSDGDENVEEEEEEDEDVDESNVKNVNYDSEENEVEYEEIVEGDEVDQMVAKKARDYFEAEAELSGSDWDSADEDEKGLDNFEAEDGDADKISEKKLQRELGRIHAHTILEEDKRDVQLLQELLLEDGELHGAGRERKFKWKNADLASWNDENRPKDDEDEVEEAENELEWRKMRHEREMFLKEQKSKLQHQQEDEEILANDSQIMQLGREALEKSLSSSNSQQSSQQKTPIAESLLTDPDIKLPFTLTHKRGSFLMRSENTLARLAEMTRTTPGTLERGPKNSRNFVFTTIEKTETFVEGSSEKKRKADPGTPKILKKMRVAESPAPQKNKKLFK